MKKAHEYTDAPVRFGTLEAMSAVVLKLQREIEDLKARVKNVEYTKQDRTPYDR